MNDTEYKLLSMTPAEPGWRAVYIFTGECDDPLLIKPVIGWGLYKVTYSGEDEPVCEIYPVIWDDDGDWAHLANSDPAYWITIPPGTDRPSADEIADELKSRHVEAANRRRAAGDLADRIVEVVIDRVQRGEPTRRGEMPGHMVSSEVFDSAVRLAEADGRLRIENRQLYPGTVAVS